jgi:A/G-specific adenine glycosylase
VPNPLANLASFRRALVSWFEKHARDYPWRRTRDPYAILVSEVMLQQTRIATVLERGFYENFLTRFPTPAELAAADDDELLRAWEGLGYYRRARMLRDTARAVVEHHGGRFPEDPDALLALPGIGRYTAGALLSFAFEIPAPIVDGNIARVLSRLFDFHQPIEGSGAQRHLWKWADRLLDQKRPHAFNSALMELGQTLCTPRNPDCARCPVRRHCSATDPASLPVRKPRPKPTEVTEHSIFARRPDGSVLLQQTDGGRRSGLWQLPLRPEKSLACLPLLATSRYTITRYRVTLHVYAADPDSPPPAETDAREQWHDPATLDAAPMAAPFRKVLDSLLAKSSNCRENGN